MPLGELLSRQTFTFFDLSRAVFVLSLQEGSGGLIHAGQPRRDVVFQGSIYSSRETSEDDALNLGMWSFWVGREAG